MQEVMHRLVCRSATHTGPDIKLFSAELKLRA